MIWIGAIIVLLSFILIVKKVEARAVLIVAGLLMCILSGQEALAGAFDAFIGQLLDDGMVPTIVFASGFSALMNHLDCTNHLVHAIAKPMHKLGFFALAFSTLATCLVNAAVPSASSTSVAVGSLFIPILMSLGYSPATAASSVLLGTFGGNLNPGASLTAQVAEITGFSTTEVWFYMLKAGGIIVVVAMIVSVVSDKVFASISAKHGQQAQIDPVEIGDDFKVDPLKAICPLIPIVLILIGVTGLLPDLPIPVWMTVGAIIAMVIDHKNTNTSIKKFFGGAGNAFGNIITLLGAAGLFTYGIEAIGLTSVLISVMENSASVARISSVGIPVVMGALTGSGNAATAAFNGAILPHAAELGFNPIHMGAAAAISGAFGRFMSPVSGACIICAGYANNIDTMEITKRNFVPAIIMGIVMMILI